MEPEQLRESLSIPSMETIYFLTEKPRQCQQTPATPVPPPVMEMMETILEFEEDEENCST